MLRVEVTLSRRGGQVAEIRAIQPDRTDQRLDETSIAAACRRRWPGGKALAVGEPAWRPETVLDERDE